MGIAPRLIILKSRQVGVSTVVEAFQFHDCHLNPHRNALVIAHNQKSTKALFRMCKRFADNLPESLKQKRKIDNVNELHFSENDSRLQVETAGEARGYTAHSVHMSEFAFYDNDHDTFKAVMQTVPNTPDSLVAIESTANGVGNAFHEVWVKAVKASGINEGAPENLDFARGQGFVPIFIPWFRHEEYMMIPWFTQADTTQEERVLARRFGLNMRQLAWRRWCIETNCKGEQETFDVEYPATWRDAFLLSGRPIFDQKAVRWLNSTIPPESNIELPPKLEVTWDEADKNPVFDEVPTRGRFWMFEPPVPRHSYILGVDPSEGDRKSDPTPIEVLDQMTLNQVAEWHGRQPPDELAVTAMQIGTHYNMGKIANEANNHGILFHHTVLSAGYPNLYYREVSDESVSGKVTEKPGLMQTNKTKHAIFNTLRKYVREKHRFRRHKDVWTIRSPILIDEIGTSIYKKSSTNQASATKIEPQPGHFIDTCLAFGIALFIHRGTEENPLEPLPEELVESVRIAVMLRAERDPEGAERESLDKLGMTCEELERLSEIRHKRKIRETVVGMGQMS